MASAKERVSRSGNGKFVVDGNYLRQQASEAFRTFMAPLSGVYGAATGTDKAESRGTGRSKKERAA